jgi:predicted AlkP superfamily phosphohydrolase/phosphomutase
MRAANRQGQPWNTTLVWALVCLLWVPACQSSRPAAHSITPSPTSRAESSPGVLMVALEGARPDTIASLSAKGVAPHFASLTLRGASAAYLQSADPPLSLPTFLTLSTGMVPSQTGLVSDRFTTPELSLAQVVDTVQQLGSYPEPVWRTAMRHGLKAALICWPAADPSVADLRANYVIAVGKSDGPPARHLVTLSPAEGWSGLRSSYTTPRQGVVRVTSAQSSTLTSLNLLALDVSDDGSGVYNVALLDQDKDLRNGYCELAIGQWTAAEISPRLHSGAYFCLTAATAITMAVYQSQVCYAQGRPIELLTTAQSQFGFPPASPDLAALNAGWISPQQYYELAARRARWTADVSTWIMREYAPDLLLTAPGIIADCSRAFLLTDPRQPSYTPEREQQYAALLERGYILADELLGSMLTDVDPERWTVMLVSPHGYMPVLKSIRVNTLLKNAGLLQLRSIGNDDYLQEDKSKAVAYAAEGSAHIYINLAGRQRLGTVDAGDYAKVQQQIVDLLSQAKDEDGTPLFANIYTQEELRTLHLDSPNSGDVFVQAQPGYTITDILGYRASVVPAEYCGAAGFSSSAEDMRGVFVAAGRGIPRSADLAVVNCLDVAPTIARLLGFTLPAKVLGKALQSLGETQ